MQVFCTIVSKSLKWVIIDEKYLNLPFEVKQ